MVAIGNFFFHYRNVLLPLFFLAVFIPSPPLLDNPTVALVTGLSIAMLGQLVRGGTIGFVYIIRGGQNRRVHAETLVTEGIFAHCRNPLYIGNILVSVGMGIASNSLAFFLFISILIIFIYEAIVRAEENFLRNKFKGDFDNYAKRVHRWIPNFAGFSETLKNHRFAWKRVIIKEYNSTYSGSTLGLLIVAKVVYDNPSRYGAFNGYLPALITVFLAFTVLYLFVRFLKKSQRLTED
jgi:protein-S-isoprenylcysteine O-methyltransferase Ste14